MCVCVCVCVCAGVRCEEYNIMTIYYFFEVLKCIHFCCSSKVCSPLSVKYGTIEMITITSSSCNLSVKPFPSLHTAYVFINSFSSYCDKNI